MGSPTRHLSAADRLLIAFDRGLRTLAAPAVSSRPHPDAASDDAVLTDEERQLSAALMRVNHTGEVCAQALYQGQAITAKDPVIREVLEAAAREETDHLAWTEARITELGGRKSVLNPLFYGGSFAIGMLSGLAGDRWNLGFLAETEKQVEGHLEDHLSRLPPADRKSRSVLETMRDDEARHARTALDHGAADFPLPFKWIMRAASKVMTRTTFRV